MNQNDRLTNKKRQQGALLKYLADMRLNKHFFHKLKFNWLRVCQRKYSLYSLAGRLYRMISIQLAFI